MAPSLCRKSSKVVIVTRESDVLRFVVDDSQGRQSAEWRVWTHKGEVYAAPRRRMKDFHVSMHRDGYAQIGLTEVVRQGARPGDRHALYRWHWNDAGQIGDSRAMLLIQFSGRHLSEDVPQLDRRSVKVPMGVEDDAVAVLLIRSDKSDEGWNDVPQTVGVLDISRSDMLVVVHLPINDEGDLSSCVFNEQRSNMPWAIPRRSGDTTFSWLVSTGTDGSVRLLEQRRDQVRQPETPDPLPPFTGQVRRWDDAPAELQGPHMRAAY